jgi:type VI secretion system FHA domain protein
MIVLTVQSFNGKSMEGPTARFDELGGTIGRADSNQLVLPDPERTISRVHAQIAFRNGSYALIDRGSSPVQVNGQPLGNGREAPIGDGDLLTIGGYQLAVAVGAKKLARDPFEDLFGGGGGGGSAPAPGSAAANLFGAPPPRMPAPAPAPAPRAKAPAADDWDFLGPLDAAPAAAPGADPFRSDVPLTAPLMAPSSGDSLDALFGLGGGSSADPFANTASAAPLAQPNTSTDADPLRAFGLAAAPVAAPASNHVSDLHTPWQAAPLREAARPPAAAIPAPTPAPPPGAVLSWDQPSREGRLVTLPGVRRPAPESLREPIPQPPAAALPDPFAAAEPESLTMIIGRGASRAPAAMPAVSVAAPPAPRPSSAPSATPATPAGGESHDELLNALAAGLGLPAARLRALDAAQMRLIGELLREATRGAVELLVARAALKREMRTDVTMIAAKENNPLKFSPSAEAALQLLLGVPTPGFMAPAGAMRDAFDDLRAHQLGVMAGMRSALDGVLQRFDPAVLEGKIAARRSALASLLPSTRKAQLWEQFQQLYAQLSSEAADDFQELFGKAFRRAYEAHIDELQDQRG